MRTGAKVTGARDATQRQAPLGAPWDLVGIGVAAIILVVIVPLILPPFRVNLLGKFLAYAIVALGLDLLWGYTGLLSLGQAVFFGLGAYAMGMYLKLEASGGKLPDFMAWSGLSRLPFFWYPFFHPIVAIAAAVLVPMLLAGLIGYLLFRRQIGSVYFAIITQALALVFSTLFIGQQPLIGGTNGLTNFTTLFGASVSSPATQLRLYQATALALLGALALARALVRSPFGKVLVAIRDSEDRVRACGYDPAVVKIAVFALSAALAGLAGALYVPQVGIVNPDALGVVLSMTVVVWVAVGGRGTLLGAVIGALFVNVAQSSFSETFPNVWQYFVGALFVATVLFFPSGVLGAARWLLDQARGGRLGDTPRARLFSIQSGPYPALRRPKPGEGES